MNLYQVNWKINLLQGLLEFREGNQKIGQLKLAKLFGNSYIVDFNNTKYIVHSELLTKNRFRIYNGANDRQLAIVTLRFWNSETKMNYQRIEYQLLSSFFGILGTYWSNKEKKRYLSFSNQLVRGKILESVPDEELYHLFIISAIQSMFIYSLLLLMALLFVTYIIF